MVIDDERSLAAKQARSWPLRLPLIFLQHASECLFATRCLVCGSTSAFELCHRCLTPPPWRATFKTCRCCQEKVDVEQDYCEFCLYFAPPFTTIRWLWHNVGNARDMLRALKFRPSLRLLNLVANLMFDEIPKQYALCSWDYIIPVPPSKKGYNERGFHHLELLAEQCARRAPLTFGKPLPHALVSRHKRRRRQSELRMQARLQGFKSRFDCKDSSIRNKRVLLLEDIVTTASTIYASAAALRRAGAATIDVVSMAVDTDWHRHRMRLSEWS